MNKFILITGASGGIGQAIALKLAKEGYNLYLHYNENNRSIENLLQELTIYNGEYIPIQADLSKPDMYEEWTRNIFSLDGIIHNAGHSLNGLITDLNYEELKSLIDVHVTAPLMLTKILLPKLMQKRSGSIIVISSIWGQTGGALEVAYSTVKGAQISFVKALSKELALNGIRVNTIAPGAIQTNMISHLSNDELHMMNESIPMGRLGSPMDVANGVSFLLSDASSYITGQTLAINGGWYV